MADKWNLDSCTIVDVSSQYEKSKLRFIESEKLKQGKEEGKKIFFNWILDSPCFLLEKVMFIGKSKL